MAQAPRVPLAWIYWKETGDLSVWKGIAQDALVMNIDDLLCVGATGPILVSSTIGRNKRLVPGEVIAALIQGTEELMAEWRKWGLDVRGTGGETADLGDLVRTVVVDSTVVCRMERDQVIDNARIQEGDVVVGLASDGQSNYEADWNGGTGSNGLTSARHDVFGPGWREKYPECFDPGLPEDLVYTGPFNVTDDVDGVPVGCRKVGSVTHPDLRSHLGGFVQGGSRAPFTGWSTAAAEAKPRCSTLQTKSFTLSRMAFLKRLPCSS